MKRTRIICLLISSSLLLWSLQYNSVLHMLKFYTNWVMYFNFFYFALGVYLQHSQDKTHLLKIYFIMCELTLFSNVLVTTVYWPLLFKDHLRQFGGEPIRLAQGIANHSVPLLTVLALFVRNPIQMIPSNCWYHFPIIICYGVYNWY